MLENKIQATPEHIYKAFNYDRNMSKAYEMGRQDERIGLPEKIQSNSASGLVTSSATPVLIPEEKETSQSFWNRLVEKNMKLAKK